MKHGKMLGLVAIMLLLVGLAVSPVMAQAPPQLFNPSVSPSSGTSSTDFYYYVNYYDADGSSPVVAQVYVDDIAYTMSLHSGSASNGVYRFGPKNLAIGSHNYYFYFDDGNDGETRLPETGSFSGPMVSPTYAQNNPPVAEGLENILDKLEVTYGFDDGEWTWYNPTWPPEASTLTTLQVQRGYWVKVTDACDLGYGTRVYGLDEGWNLIGWVGW